MMKQNHKILASTVMAVWLICSVVLMSSCGMDADGEMVGSTPDAETAGETTVETTVETAPDIVVTDRNGDAVRLSDFKGTPVVLNFWATWCSPCKQKCPTLTRRRRRTETRSASSWSTSPTVSEIR